MYKEKSSSTHLTHMNMHKTMIRKRDKTTHKVCTTITIITTTVLFLCSLHATIQSIHVHGANTPPFPFQHCINCCDDGSIPVDGFCADGSSPRGGLPRSLPVEEEYPDIDQYERYNSNSPSHSNIQSRNHGSSHGRHGHGRLGNGIHPAEYASITDQKGQRHPPAPSSNSKSTSSSTSTHSASWTTVTPWTNTPHKATTFVRQHPLRGGSMESMNGMGDVGAIGYASENGAHSHDATYSTGGYNSNAGASSTDHMGYGNSDSQGYSSDGNYPTTAENTSGDVSTGVPSAPSRAHNAASTISTSTTFKVTPKPNASASLSPRPSFGIGPTASTPATASSRVTSNDAHVPLRKEESAHSFEQQQHFQEEKQEMEQQQHVQRQILKRSKVKHEYNPNKGTSGYLSSDGSQSTVDASSQRKRSLMDYDSIALALRLTCEINRRLNSEDDPFDLDEDVSQSVDMAYGSGMPSDHNHDGSYSHHTQGVQVVGGGYQDIQPSSLVHVHPSQSWQRPIATSSHNSPPTHHTAASAMAQTSHDLFHTPSNERMNLSMYIQMISKQLGIPSKQPMIHAIALIYLDRACSVQTLREGDINGMGDMGGYGSGSSPNVCPFLTKATVHKLYLSAVLLACRTVRNEWAVDMHQHYYQHAHHQHSQYNPCHDEITQQYIQQLHSGVTASSSSSKTSHRNTKLFESIIGSTQDVAEQMHWMILSMGVDGLGVELEQVESYVENWRQLFVWEEDEEQDGTKEKVIVGDQSSGYREEDLAYHH